MASRGKRMLLAHVSKCVSLLYKAHVLESKNFPQYVHVCHCWCCQKQNIDSGCLSALRRIIFFASGAYDPEPRPLFNKNINLPVLEENVLLKNQTLKNSWRKISYFFCESHSRHCGLLLPMLYSLSPSLLHRFPIYSKAMLQIQSFDPQDTMTEQKILLPAGRFQKYPFVLLIPV